MSLANDMSTLTTIPVSILNRLFEKEELCILHKFFENEKNGEPVTYMDLGFGTVYIKHEGEELKYKFTPSKSFEKSLINIVNTKESPLITTIEDSLKERIINTYKDLF